MKEEDTVYAWISLVNGSNVNPAGGTMQEGQDFYWANSASSAVTVSNCGGFCVDSSYNVPVPPQGQTYGLKKATLLTSPTNWTFTENPNQWNTPGVPRITNPPMPSPLNIENKEVA
jgi:hypothetical protein